MADSTKYAELKKRYDSLLSKYNKSILDYNKGWDSFPNKSEDASNKSQDFLDGYRSRLASELESEFKDLIFSLKLKTSMIDNSNKDNFVSKETYDSVRNELYTEIEKYKIELNNLKEVEKEMLRYIEELSNLESDKESTISTLQVEKEMLTNKCSFYQELFNKLFNDSSIFKLFVKSLEDKDFLDIISSKLNIKSSFLLYLKGLFSE
jgi:hypothetical protein